jgi:hypothetical protein
MVSHRRRAFRTNLITVEAIIMAIQNTTDDASEISSLSQAVESLASSVRLWNIAYLLLLALTLIAAAFVVLKNNEHNRAQAKLSRAKDRTLRLELKEKDDQIAITQRQAAEANLRAAGANKIAEEERLARVKLETRLAPRSLKGESQESVAGAIRQFAPQPFDILWYSDDPDSANLASDLYVTFQRAGWVLDRSNEGLGLGGSTGVVIEFAPSKEDVLGPACDALASALQKEGIAATTRPRVDEDKEKEPERLRINVGRKP